MTHDPRQPCLDCGRPTYALNALCPDCAQQRTRQERREVFAFWRRRGWLHDAMTVPEVARLLGMSENRVRVYLQRGQLVGAKAGRKKRWIVKAEDLEDFINAST